MKKPRSASVARPDENLQIRKTPLIRAMNPRQKDYISAICNGSIIIADGPAGTGKTYIATMKALDLLLSGQCSQLILTRPGVPAGEKMGFLPGTAEEKYAPYLRPYMKALKERLHPDLLKKMLEDERIMAEPIAFIQGMSFDNAIVLVDEAENLELQQIKLILTRLGIGSRAVFMGDLDQSYIRASGFKQAIAIWGEISTVITFEVADVVRSPTCKKVLEAYAAYEKLHGRIYVN